MTKRILHIYKFFFFLAESDPHFLLKASGGASVCFDVTAKNGTIVQLLHDSQITLNARLVEYEANRTFFGQIAAALGRHRIIVTPRKILVDSAPYRWTNAGYKLNVSAITSIIVSRFRVKLKIKQGSTITILRHLAATDRPDHLGIYIKRSKADGRKGSGLLAFLRRSRVRMEEFSNRTEISLFDGDKFVKTVEGKKSARYSRLKKKRIDCWLVKKLVNVNDFVVPFLTFNVRA